MPVYTLVNERTSQVPEYSPGIVKNEETLLRTVFSPEDFKDGQIGPKAFPCDQIKKNGLSLDREEHASNESIKQKASKLQQRNPNIREAAFVLALECGRIRKIEHNENQALLVIDDATPENPAHASIYSNSELDLKNAELRKIRDYLIQITKSVDKIETVEK